MKLSLLANLLVYIGGFLGAVATFLGAVIFLGPKVPQIEARLRQHWTLRPWSKELEEELVGYPIMHISLAGVMPYVPALHRFSDPPPTARRFQAKTNYIPIGFPVIMSWKKLITETMIVIPLLSLLAGLTVALGSWAMDAYVVLVTILAILPTSNLLHRTLSRHSRHLYRVIFRSFPIWEWLHALTYLVWPRLLPAFLVQMFGATYVMHRGSLLWVAGPAAMVLGMFVAISIYNLLYLQWIRACSTEAKRILSALPERTIVWGYANGAVSGRLLVSQLEVAGPGPEFHVADFKAIRVERHRLFFLTLAFAAIGTPALYAIAILYLAGTALVINLDRFLLWPIRSCGALGKRLGATSLFGVISVAVAAVALILLTLALGLYLASFAI